MALKKMDHNKEQLNNPIIHINNIGLDNRRENIIYDVPNKNIRKNSKKKREQ